MRIVIEIQELTPGSVAVVVGYSRIYGGYIGRLISQGLVPGTRFVVLSLDMAQGEAQIMLQEKIVTLSKPEVNALCVEILGEEDNDDTP